MSSRGVKGCLHEQTEYQPLPQGGFVKKCSKCKTVLEGPKPEAKPVTENQQGPKLLTEDL